MDNFILRKCKFCSSEFKVKIVTAKGRKNYGKPLKKDENKKFCSLKCLNDWQKITPWEKVIGKENANRIREDRRKQFEIYNPSRDSQEVRDKISKSLSNYLSKNKECRMGENNPFYNRKHTEETKKFLKESKQGKWSYNEEQYKKLLKNTPRGENHPNYGNGLSDEGYPCIFNKNLKDKIKDRDNYICQNCGKKTQKLAIHHIDYVKENCDEKNLISLCYSCHPKTNFNRDSWMIKFNYDIKKIYEKNNKN
jgi:hypothetical protein